MSKYGSRDLFYILAIFGKFDYHDNGLSRKWKSANEDKKNPELWGLFSSFVKDQTRKRVDESLQKNLIFQPWNVILRKNSDLTSLYFKKIG